MNSLRSRRWPGCTKSWARPSRTTSVSSRPSSPALRHLRRGRCRSGGGGSSRHSVGRTWNVPRWWRPCTWQTFFVFFGGCLDVVVGSWAGDHGLVFRSNFRLFMGGLAFTQRFNIPSIYQKDPVYDGVGRRQICWELWRFHTPKSVGLLEVRPITMITWTPFFSDVCFFILFSLGVFLQFFFFNILTTIDIRW